MESAVLVDSSYFVRSQRQGRDPFTELGAFADRYEFFTCGMVTMEVLRGIHAAHRTQRYRTGFSVRICVPTTSRIWDLATDLSVTLDRKGTPIPPQDTLIAAHAIQAGVAVLTLDNDFRRIPALTVLDSLE